MPGPSAEEMHHEQNIERFLSLEHRLTRVEVILLALAVTVWGMTAYQLFR